MLTYKLKDNTIEIVENSDSVSHPSHYAEGWSNGAEVIDLTEHLSFCAGNIVKYVCRAGRKDPGKHVEDLEKARWYIDREIERVKSQLCDTHQPRTSPGTIRLERGRS